LFSSVDNEKNDEQIRGFESNLIMAFGLGGERCYIVGTGWWRVCEKE
jgi:hypothetical protein